MMSINHIKVVAFDCDGVMFDSKKSNAAFYNHIMQHFNMPELNNHQLTYVHMHTVDESLAFLIQDENILSQAQAYRKNLSYLPFLKHMIIEPGLIALLKKLRTRYKTAVATNRTDTMDRVLVENRIDHLFDFVVCALDVQFPKPHPEQLHKVADHFNASPDEVIYIGDSKLDQKASNAAGIPFVAYDNRTLEADYHICRLIEMEAILGLS